MPRLKLDIPENTIASITIPVRISDINYGNHVGNDSFVSILHEARVQWLQQHNYSELNIDGSSLIMSGLAIDFKSESFYGDILTVTISCGDISKVGFELYYKLTTQREDKTVLIAYAKTDMICFDYAIKKIAALSNSLLVILQKNIT